MADNKKVTIVIKKVRRMEDSYHGGSWKVAMADFMTSLMAFFLLMWLLNQTPDVKKNVSDYFSTPSVIEYNFSNFGVELTLEKLFLDLVNEPLKVLQDFMTPADYTPNFLQMGSKNIVLAELNSDLGEYSTGFEVTGDSIVIKLPESKLFVDGTANPLGQFGTVMDKLSKFTAGLEDADIFMDSRVYINSVKGQNEDLAQRVAEKRLDMVLAQVNRKLEHQSVDLHEKAEAEPGKRQSDGRPEEGYIKIEIKQKELRSDGTKPRKMGRILGRDDDSMDVYNNFVNKMTTSQKKKDSKQTE